MEQIEDESNIDIVPAGPQSKIRVVETSPKGRFQRVSSTQLNQELGTGTYKTVWKAIDNDTGCQVAWNIVQTSGLSQTDKERIRKEIEIIKQLKHPNIIQFISAWHNRELQQVVFITEIVSGGPLSEYIKQIGHPRLKLIKQWAREILKGLDYLHTQKPYPIIHRDLKCENIFIMASTSEIRIGDLGLSTFMTNEYNHTMVGTPHYMAPEYFDECYDCSVDIYAFGLCVLEMCTETVPYSECKTYGDMFKTLRAGIKPYSLQRIVDKELKSFIELCLQPASERPSASELLESSYLKNDLGPEVNLPVELKEEKLEVVVRPISTDFRKFMPKERHINKLHTVDLIGMDFPSEVELCIEIGVESGNGGLEYRRYEFVYNFVEDTPEKVAHELVSMENWKDEYESLIADVLIEKLHSEFGTEWSFESDVI